MRCKATAFALARLCYRAKCSRLRSVSSAALRAWRCVRYSNTRTQDRIRYIIRDDWLRINAEFAALLIEDYRAEIEASMPSWRRSELIRHLTSRRSTTLIGHPLYGRDENHAVAAYNSQNVIEKFLALCVQMGCGKCAFVGHHGECSLANYTRLKCQHPA